MTDQPPYGQPEQPGQPAPQWQQPAPGGPPLPPAQGQGHPYAAAPAYAAGDGPWGPLATWGTRVAAMLVDSLLQLIGLVPYIVGFVLIVAGSPDTSSYETPVGPGPDETNTRMIVAGVVLVGVGVVLMIGISLWNRVFRMGRTGQSVGKKVMGIRLVEERTGRPMGAGMCFVRELAHFLDGIAYIGYLWPLWDAKRQTFADMVMSTVVVRAPKA
jgi:uncharacterized RDD family membrane protein YckC